MSGQDPSRQQGGDASPESLTTSPNPASQSFLQQRSPLLDQTRSHSTNMAARSEPDSSENRASSVNNTTSLSDNTNTTTALASPLPSISAATSTSSAVANARTSPLEPQPSQPVLFGPPRPPVSQSSPSRADAGHTHPGIPEGVIQGILEGIFGPMSNFQAVRSGASTQNGTSQRQEEALRSSPIPNANRNGQAPGNNGPGRPDLGTMFSMFGLPPASMVSPATGSGSASTNNPEQPSRPGSSSNQHNDTSPFAMPSGPQSANGPEAPPHHHHHFSSEFSLTFDLGPMGIPAITSPGNSSANMDTSDDENRGSQQPGSLSGASLGNGATNQSSSSGPASNGQNANQRPPPLAFIIGPNGNWMQPNFGAADRPGASENTSGVEGQNGASNQDVNRNPSNGGDAENQAAPLFQIFSRLFPQGLQPGVNPPMMNLAFGFPSFMQTRLPPDPERAEELLRGLKDPGMDLMMRLDRIVRADNSGTTGTGNTEGDAEGDADGWKCAVCMEGLEDEFEAHKHQEPSSSDTDQADVQEDGSVNMDRVSRNPSISSDLDMHDVEMVLYGESRQNPRNKTSLKLFPCHHVFHEDCLKPWLAQKTTCPTCRFDIDPHSVTLRRPVMPQGRNNPLRPRNRNVATSNVRATPYASRPVSPGTRAQEHEQRASDRANAAQSSSDTPRHAVAASGETATPFASTAGGAASSTAPAFTQSDVPRSPFAFPRPERDAQTQANSTSGNIDRPPPAARPEQSGGSSHDGVDQGQNGFAPMDQDHGANMVVGDMREAVRMLQEIMRRNDRESRASGGDRENQSGISQTGNTSASGQGAANDGPHADDPAGSQRDNQINNTASDAHPEPQDDRHPDQHRHSQTIAIFEIALPDMSAEMMPDTFQGLNDNAPQAFGPSAFRSFVVPFPRMEGVSQNSNRNSTTGGNSNVNETGTTGEGGSQSMALDIPNDSAGTSDRSTSGDGSAALTDPAAQVEGQNPPPHPSTRLHRWLSDPESRQRPVFNFPLPTLNPDQRPDRDASPMERRRGEEQWVLPRVKESFAEWITSREKALRWRCDDPVCLYAPPEHPFTEMAEDQWQEWKPTDQKLVKINSYKQYRFVDEAYTGPRPVCHHEFHPSCLKVSCLSSNWWYREPGREETTVRCPKCRMQGWIVDDDGEAQDQTQLNTTV